MSGADGKVTSLALLSSSVLVQAITFLLRPAATYRAIELDAPTVALGALGATFAIVPLVLAVPFGRLVDRVGERRMMLAGSFLILASGVLFVTLAHTLPGLVIATGVLGAGHLGCVVGQQARVANSAQSDRLVALFGYYTFAASLGQAIGPLIIVAFGRSSTTPDTTGIFWSATVMAVALIVSTIPLHSTKPDRPAGGSASPTGSLRELIRTPGLTSALLTCSIIVAAVDLTLVYLPALGADRGLTAATVGMLLAVRAGSSMLSRLVLGRLSRILGRTRLLIFSIVVAAVSLAATPIPMPTWLLMITVAFVGIGLGVGQPLTMSWLAEVAPSGMRGRAMSLRLMGNRMGQVAIPSAIGLLAAGAGTGGVLWATAAAVGLTAFLFRGTSLDGPGTTRDS